jgi:hypothetical protein
MPYSDQDNKLKPTLSRSEFEIHFSPEQRLEAVAEILANIATRVIKKRHGENTSK